jgi:putative membrane protein
MKIRLIIFTLLLALPRMALAHVTDASHDEPPRPANWHELWRTWGWEPVSWIVLIATAILYTIGLRRVWRSSRIGGGVKRWEAGCFAAGWIALFIALVSPLHPWGSVLMSAHMSQHEILMLVAAPLLVLGRPLVVFMLAIPQHWSRTLAQLSNAPSWQRTWHFICNPFVAWLIHAIVLWAWHIPKVFDATLHDEWIHFAQHTCFIITAIIFWWAVMTTRSAVMSYGVALLYMFTTALHTQLLGVLMTFSKTVWYPTYARTTQTWGLTPLEDQQLGGLIMWIPAGVVYIIAALALVAGWMREAERRAQRNESVLATSVTPT